MLQIRQHTDRGENLQALRSVILMGWPNCTEEPVLAMREYWPVKEELSVQNGVIFKGHHLLVNVNYCNNSVFTHVLDIPRCIGMC
jgi:hypothetical protein